MSKPTEQAFVLYDAEPPSSPSTVLHPRHMWESVFLMQVSRPHSQSLLRSPGWGLGVYVVNKLPGWLWCKGSPNYTLRNTTLHGQASPGQRTPWGWKKTRCMWPGRHRVLCLQARFLMAWTTGEPRDLSRGLQVTGSLQEIKAMKRFFLSIPKHVKCEINYNLKKCEI